MNLSKNTLIARVIRSNWFPLVLQVLMFLAFGAIVWGGWGITSEDATFAKILRNTNLSNLLVWSYWWPMIVVCAILLGRVWCTVCPMELVSYLASRVGLRRPVPKFFKSGWLITVFYVVTLVVGVHTFSIHRQPHRMALYMMILMWLALVFGLLFQRRAFCSYVCPVGHLLGLYSRMSILKWGVADTQVCDTCRTKDCIEKDRHYRLIGRSCTSGLYPATMQNPEECLLCTQCAKACPNQNVALSLRVPFKGMFGSTAFRNSQIAFVMILSGFVVYEILSEWSSSKAILTWIPKALVDATHMVKPLDGLLSSMVMFIGYPLVLYAGVWLLSTLFSHNSVKSIAGALSLLLLPMMAGAHLVKACLKMTSRLPYWNYVFTDPLGINTADRLHNGALELDKTIPNMLGPWLTAMMVLIMLATLFVSTGILRRSETLQSLDRGGRMSVAMGALLYWIVFAVTIVAWRI